MFYGTTATLVKLAITKKRLALNANSNGETRSMFKAYVLHIFNSMLQEAQPKFHMVHALGPATTNSSYKSPSNSVIAQCDAGQIVRLLGH